MFADCYRLPFCAIVNNSSAAYTNTLQDALVLAQSILITLQYEGQEPRESWDVLVRFFLTPLLLLLLRSAICIDVAFVLKEEGVPPSH